MDFPNGAVFWQIDWIIDFTRSSSFSVSSPVFEIIFSPASPNPAVFFFFPNLPIAMLFWFLFYSKSAYFSFFTSSSPSYMSSWTFLLYSCLFFGFWITFWGASYYFGSSTFGFSFSTGFFTCPAGWVGFYWGTGFSFSFYFSGCCWTWGFCSSGFFIFAADGGLSIFFFSGLASAYSAAPPPNTFFT